jgi:hypothetical protein
MRLLVFEARTKAQECHDEEQLRVFRKMIVLKTNFAMAKPSC